MSEPLIVASDPTKPTLQGMGKTFGETGTAIMGGIITAEEYNNRLRGKPGLQLFDIMRKSEESVRAALQMVKLPLLSLDRTIKPASDDPLDQYKARFIDHELFHGNINFHKMACEAMTFFDMGHAVAEKTYMLTAFEGQTRIGIKEIGFRKQRSILRWATSDFKPGITQILITPQDGSPAERSIPRGKLIVWTNDQEGDNYEGVSMLRYAFKSWDMQDKLGLVHAIGLEKMSIPTPVLHIPLGADSADIENAKKSLRQYRANEEAFITVPAGWVLDKLDMSGQSMSEMLPALEHYEVKILLSVLGQFLMMGTKSSGTGSRAVSQDHSKLFMLSEEAANKTFQDSVQQDLINQLCDLNFSDMSSGYPTLISSAVSDEDVAVLSAAMKDYTDGGLLTPTFETEQFIRKAIHAPELTDDYKDDYEKKRQQRLTEPAVLPGSPNLPNPTPAPTDKKTAASLALRQARQSRRNLIDILVRE